MLTALNSFPRRLDHVYGNSIGRSGKRWRGWERRSVQARRGNVRSKTVDNSVGQRREHSYKHSSPKESDTGALADSQFDTRRERTMQSRIAAF